MSIKASPVISINQESAPLIQNAVVTSVAADGIKIVLEGQTVRARKAFSCVIDPAPDDTVLCCRNNYGDWFVLAIVERPDNGKMQVSFPSDVTFEARQGNMSLFSGKSVTIAAENLNTFSRKTINQSGTAYIAFDKISASGSELQASYQTVRLISNLINTMARQVIDKFMGYIRHTEDHDQVQAGQLTRRTDGLFSLDSGNTVMISKKETKIDGEKIYMA